MIKPNPPALSTNMNFPLWKLFFSILLWTLSSAGILNVSSVSDLFGTTLYKWNLDKTELIEVNTKKTLKDTDIVGIYYSASWCGPCKKFTPQLVSFYNELKSRGKSMEIIFVSGDNSPAEFLKYYAHMPWLAVSWDNIKFVNDVTASALRVRGIPHLVFLDVQDFEVFTVEGRAEVLRDPYGLEFPWGSRITSIVPKPLQRFLKRQVQAYGDALGRMVRGLMSQVAPEKVVKFVLNSTKVLVTKLLTTVYTLLKGQLGL